jgi:hypothetical protein
MKHLLITLILLTSFFGFNQLNTQTSEQIEIDDFYRYHKESAESILLGEINNDFILFVPKGKEGVLMRLNKSLELVESIQIDLDLKKSTSRFKLCRKIGNEIHIFIEHVNDKLKEKNITVYKFKINDFSFINKKIIHKFSFSNHKYRLSFSTYYLLESEDKEKFKILLVEKLHQSHSVGDKLNKGSILELIDYDEHLNIITKNKYLLDRKEFNTLQKKTLTNSGELYLNYKDISDVNIANYLIDPSEEEPIKINNLSFGDLLTVSSLSISYIQGVNNFTNEINLFAATVDKTDNITYHLINEQSESFNTTFKIPGSEKETTKRCEFSNLHSVNSINDGFIIISEFALQKKGEEPRMIGGSQEFKDDYAFGISNSHIIITKINLKGELVWNRVIENVRTNTKKPFPHSFVLAGEIAYLLFVDYDINTQTSKTKLSEINLKTNSISTKEIASNNQYTKTKAQLNYLTTETERLYFIQSKSDKITINSTILEF